MTAVALMLGPLYFGPTEVVAMAAATAALLLFRDRIVAFIERGGDEWK